jgi:hypothetical protein
MRFNAVKSEGEKCQGVGQRKVVEAEVYPPKLRVCERINYNYLIKLDQSNL